MEINGNDYNAQKMFGRLLKAGSHGCSIEVVAATKVIAMLGSKRDLIFYIVAANLIGILLGITGADLFTILIASLVGPPVILLIYRIIRYVWKI